MTIEKQLALMTEIERRNEKRLIEAGLIHAQSKMPLTIRKK